MTIKPNKKLSFVLYEDKKNPKYFEIKKGVLKFILIAPPVISITALFAILLGLTYFNQIRELIEKKEPAIIQELKSKNAQMDREKQELVNFSKTLQKKLLSDEPTQLDYLYLFQKHRGSSVKLSPATFSIDKVEINKKSKEDKVELKFNLVNIIGKKQSGYLFILMATPNGIQFYPKNILSSEKMLIKFNTGESFYTSRFRPVKADFNLNANSGATPFFKVLVFSRVGDLIHEQIINK